ncbi:MAG: hypothetical protein K2X87_03655 [Gemmataceae bacterium]|nr:hypothetical protein [Gemmataceae bacterium]
MSDPTLRAAGDLVHILTFAVVGGVWLIGGAVFSVYLLRASLGAPASLPRGKGDPTADRVAVP